MRKKILLSLLSMLAAFMGFCGNAGEVTVEETDMIGNWLRCEKSASINYGFVLQPKSQCVWLYPDGSTGNNWAVKNSTLSISIIDTTGKTIEIAYQIVKRDDYSIETVRLEGKKKIKETFRKSLPLSEIENSKWKIQFIQGKFKGMIPFYGENHLIFNTEKGAHGYTGCNRFNAKYTLDTKEHKISIPKLNLDKQFKCPGMDGELNLNQTLSSVTGYLIQDRVLYLLKGNVVVLTAQEY